MKRKLLVTLLILSLLTGLLALPATAATVLASGDCGKTGNDVTWTLDRDGLLTVSGTGEMADYDNADDVPWHSYLSLVTSVEIQSGVETVGMNAFQSCTNLESVTLPAQGLRSIGDVAFYHCDALAAITYPGHPPFPLSHSRRASRISAITRSASAPWLRSIFRRASRPSARARSTNAPP